MECCVFDKTKKCFSGFKKFETGIRKILLKFTRLKKIGGQKTEGALKGLPLRRAFCLRQKDP